MATHGSPSNHEANAAQLRVVRVKRKRKTEAPDNLVIETLPNASNNSNDLADTLNSLGLQQETQAPRPKRYRRLATLTPAELLTTDSDALRELLATKQATPSKHQKDSQQQQSTSRTKVPRYEQIRHRQGLTNFEVTESARDPLRGLAAVHDVVCMDVDDEDEDKIVGTASLPNSEAPNTQQQPQQPAGGDTLLCNYMPMVREYLEEQGADRNGADIDLDEYVYDLYVEAAGGSGSRSGAAANDEAVNDDGDDGDDTWWQLHGRGIAPVVRILEDDTWLVAETSDVEDSLADSEDSNAEGYFGNDYPDEDEYDAYNEDGDAVSGSDNRSSESDDYW